MDIIEVIRTSLRALRTNKTRTLLTMLGVIIGVTSVILLVSIGNGLQTYITTQLESLGADSLFVTPGNLQMEGGGGMQGAGMTTPKFTFEHVNQLKKEGETIKTVMAYMKNNATLKYKGKTHIPQVVGVGSEYPQIRNHKVIQGNFFNNSQYSSAKKVVVLGTTVVSKLFGLKNPVGEKITLSNQQYQVIGIMEEKGSLGGMDQDNQVYIPATTAMRQFDMQYIQSLWIQSKSTKLISQTKFETERILLKTLNKDDFSIVDTKSILNVMTSILGVLTTALGGIAAISLLVGGVGIMNIMFVSVTERTREIGLRKAMGATPNVIRKQFLIEAGVLSVGGGIIGIILGVLGSFLIGYFFVATVALWSIALAFIVSAGIGIAFGVFPAIKAARLNPIEALRYE